MIFLQDCLHVFFCTLRKIAIEDSPENVITELTSVHASAQIISNSPELLGQFVRLCLKSFCLFAFTHLLFALRLELLVCSLYEIDDLVDQRCYLQQ